VVDFALKEGEEAIVVTRLHGDTGYLDYFFKLTVPRLENINPLLYGS
jgi:hypothetical protein